MNVEKKRCEYKGSKDRSGAVETWAQNLSVQQILNFNPLSFGFQAQNKYYTVLPNLISPTAVALCWNLFFPVSGPYHVSVVLRAFDEYQGVCEGSAPQCRATLTARS
jgi:hypothetical protein